MFCSAVTMAHVSLIGPQIPAVLGAVVPSAAGALHRLAGNIFVQEYRTAAGSGSSKAETSAGSKTKPAAKAAVKAAGDAAPKSTTKKAARDKPVRALSAYTCFVKAESNRFFKKGERAVEGMQRASAAWSALSDAQKAPYLAMAQESKATATQAKEEAKANRAPPSAYSGFVKGVILRLRAERPGVPVTQLMAEAAAEWRQLPEAEKARLKLDAQRAKAEWVAARAAAV